MRSFTYFDQATDAKLGEYKAYKIRISKNCKNSIFIHSHLIKA